MRALFSLAGYASAGSLRSSLLFTAVCAVCSFLAICCLTSNGVHFRSPISSSRSTNQTGFFCSSPAGLRPLSTAPFSPVPFQVALARRYRGLLDILYHSRPLRHLLLYFSVACSSTISGSVSKHGLEVHGMIRTSRTYTSVS